jgi:predicted phosphodiesterase
MQVFYKKLNNFKRFYSVKIQYVSDVHVDYKNYIPHIEPQAKNLIVAGDIGLPNHKNVKLFMDTYSKKFEKIFVVAGNHDYRCSAKYNKKNVDIYKKIFVDMYNAYNNVYLLDRTAYKLSEDVVITGATLWSAPQSARSCSNDNKLIDHINEHNNDVEWIRDICEEKYDKKIIMVSHYVPSFKLIEQKYLRLGINNTSLFASDLDYLIKKPVVAWICGHTHSVMDMKINGVYCGVNALGHGSGRCKSKVICVE